MSIFQSQDPGSLPQPGFSLKWIYRRRSPRLENESRLLGSSARPNGGLENLRMSSRRCAFREWFSYRINSQSNSLPDPLSTCFWEEVLVFVRRSYENRIECGVTSV